MPVGVLAGQGEEDVAGRDPARVDGRPDDGQAATAQEEPGRGVGQLLGLDDDERIGSRRPARRPALLLSTTHDGPCCHRQASSSAERGPRSPREAGSKADPPASTEKPPG